MVVGVGVFEVRERVRILKGVFVGRLAVEAVMFGVSCRR